MEQEGAYHLRLGPSHGWLRTLVLLVALLSPSLSSASSVTLAWDKNTEPDLDGYRLHYGLASGSYTIASGLVKNPPTGNTVTHTVYLPDHNRYYFAVKAYDKKGHASDFSNEVAFPPPEVISRPLPPVGPTSLQAGVSYVFSARGLVTSWGDAVQYRFLWSDRTDSGWLPVGVIEATKSWNRADTYTDVRVEARCSGHPLVVSPASDSITVIVAPAPTERISLPTVPTGAKAVTSLGASKYSTGGSASDANHPVEYRFSWGDGTVSPWITPGAAGRAEVGRTWSLPGTYSVRTEARCQLHPSVFSALSSPLEVDVRAADGEVIVAPSAPAGPGDGLTGIVYGYTTGSASSSIGDPVQYRFRWGDGTASPWLTPGATGAVKASKSWPTEGSYPAVAEARCALHPSFSAVSGAFNVLASEGDSLILADSFTDGNTAGDPQWQTLSGKWLVGADKVFTSGSVRAINRAVVRTLPEFRAGRISTWVKLTKSSLPNGAGIVFSLSDARSYRYVLIRGSRIHLGQVGDLPGEKGGIKASASRGFRADRWYRLRADFHPDGLVEVFLDKGKKPVLAYRFADTVAGRLGSLAQRSVAHFDDFRAWDARALP